MHYIFYEFGVTAEEIAQICDEEYEKLLHKLIEDKECETL